MRVVGAAASRPADGFFGSTLGVGHVQRVHLASVAQPMVGAAGEPPETMAAYWQRHGFVYSDVDAQRVAQVPEGCGDDIGGGVGEGAWARAGGGEVRGGGEGGARYGKEASRGWGWSSKGGGSGPVT